MAQVRILIVSAATVLAVSAVNTQSTAPDGPTQTAIVDPPRVVLDVVSIKQAEARRETPAGSLGTIVVPAGGGRMMVTNYTVLSLIAAADPTFRQADIHGGPDWIRSSVYDVVATVREGPTRDAVVKQFPALLRGILDERFQLRTHVEMRPARVYALVKTGTNLGPKLQVSQTNCEGYEERLAALPAAERMAQLRTLATSPRPMCGVRTGSGVYAAGSVTMDAIARGLSSSVDRVVVNRTGLDGVFDIELRWTPAHPLGATPDLAVDRPPSIFVAIEEQLGLKLESQEEPRPALVIDSIQRPTPN